MDRTAGNGRLRTRARKPGRRRGQALVEFALVVPLLLLLIVIVIDFGRALYVQTAIQNGAREGARFGSVHPQWVDNATPGLSNPDPNNVKYRASTEPAATVPSTNVTVTCTNAGVTESCTVAGSGHRIDVRVTATFTPITPLISNIVGTNLTLAGDTVMVIE